MCARSVRRGAMHTTPALSSRSCRNKLLAHLPAAEYRRVSATLDPIPLPFQHLLLKPGEPLDHVYFPGNGVCSVTQAMRDGRTVEVATVGNEGLIGLSALSGGRSFVGVLVKVSESAGHVMSVGAFRREMRRRG